MLEIFNDLTDDKSPEEANAMIIRHRELWNEATQKSSKKAEHLRAKSLFLRAIAERIIAKEMEKRWREATNKQKAARPLWGVD